MRNRPAIPFSQLKSPARLESRLCVQGSRFAARCGRRMAADAETSATVPRSGNCLESASSVVVMSKANRLVVGNGYKPARLEGTLASSGFPAGPTHFQDDVGLCSTLGGASGWQLQRVAPPYCVLVTLVILESFSRRMQMSPVPFASSSIKNKSLLPSDRNEGYDI